MQLAELLSELGVDGFSEEARHLEIKHITDDSREVKPASLFVAIKGYHHDGRLYIDEAISRGAVAVLAESPVSAKVPAFTVENARKALGILLSALYGHPSRRLRVVGVTGTNGKTTTTHMIETILRHQEKKTGLVGTVVTRIASRSTGSSITTPEATELQFLLKEMVERKVEYAVLEVSSHGLELDRVAGIEFDTAILTNISTDHLDMHQSLEQYLAAKAKLFQSLKPAGVGIINLDDKYAPYFARACPGQVLTYGFTPQADYQVKELLLEKAGSSSHLVVNGGPSGAGREPLGQTLELSVPGRHNVYNALAALATAEALGIPLSQSLPALREFRGVRRRLQVIHDQGFTVIDDFAHNPGSLKAVMEAVRLMDYEQLIVVNAIRGNRGVEVNRENAKVLASYLPAMRLKRLIATRSIDTVSGKDEVTPEEVAAFLAPFSRVDITVELHAQLADAITAALSAAGQKDLVVLLGAQGMDAGAEICRKTLSQHLLVLCPPLSPPLLR